MICTHCKTHFRWDATFNSEVVILAVLVGLLALYFAGPLLGTVFLFLRKWVSFALDIINILRWIVVFGLSVSLPTQCEARKVIPKLWGIGVIVVVPWVLYLAAIGLSIVFQYIPLAVMAFRTYRRFDLNRRRQVGKVGSAPAPPLPLLLPMEKMMFAMALFLALPGVSVVSFLQSTCLRASVEWI